VAAALLVASLGGTARAATDPPLAPTLEVSALRGLRRLALAIDGDETPAALAARAEVEAAFKQTGHAVTVLPAASVSLPPDRAMLDVAGRYGAEALALLEIPPGYGSDAFWLAVYDLSGARVFAYGGRIPSPVVPLAPVVAAPPTGAVDLRVLPFLEGADFYRAVGRPDLATRYENRRAGKTALRVGGSVLLVGGVLVGILDLLATAATNVDHGLGCVGGSSADCQAQASASPLPWIAALAGLGMLIAPACYSTDPLSASEKAALLSNTTTRTAPRPSFSLSAAPAPAPGGGTVMIGGRF